MFKVTIKTHGVNGDGVFLVSLLLTLNIFLTVFYTSIANFEQVNACWEVYSK